MAKEIKCEKRSLFLITTEGKEVIINYEINEDADDFVLEEVREALKNSSIYSLEYDGINWGIKFGGQIISEIDFKKIIGINWL